MQQFLYGRTVGNKECADGGIHVVQLLLNVPGRTPQHDSRLCRHQIEHLIPSDRERVNGSAPVQWNRIEGQDAALQGAAFG